jgi:FkbM family methyltransferase
MIEDNVAVETTSYRCDHPVGGSRVSKIMPKIVKGGIKRLLYRLGFGLCRQDDLPGSVRMKMIQHHGIQTVIDVGGNVGGYGAEVREYGYSGRIISFEPTAQAYERLAARAKTDPKWIVSKTAIGEFNGEVKINVAANEAKSSSLLPMLGLHAEYAPDACYVSSEQVPLNTLNTVLGGILLPEEKVLLKIDTQGYEHMVLKGASDILRQVELVECELSLVALYDGQLLFDQMIALLRNLGFEPVRFTPGFTDPQSGHNLQIDAIFSRSERSNRMQS